MASVASYLEQRQSRKTRPDHYEELLLHPLTDGQGKATKFGSYEGWETDHSIARRFYVAGIRWLLGSTGLTQATLVNHREKAQERILQITSWAEMDDPNGHWEASLGRPQILHACGSEPMPFAKAAQVLMTCEIAIEDLLSNPKKKNRVPKYISEPQHIHGYMGILPACSNIDDFSEDYLKAVQSRFGDPLSTLRDEAGLRAQKVLTDLAKGATVTEHTARAVRESALRKFPGPDLKLGEVRSRPGRFLGTGNASDNEQVEVC